MSVNEGKSELIPALLLIDELARGKGVGQLIAKDEGSSVDGFERLVHGLMRTHKSTANLPLQIAQVLGALNHVVACAQTLDEAELLLDAEHEVG